MPQSSSCRKDHKSGTIDCCSQDTSEAATAVNSNINQDCTEFSAQCQGRLSPEVLNTPQAPDRLSLSMGGPGRSFGLDVLMQMKMDVVRSRHLALRFPPPLESRRVRAWSGQAGGHKSPAHRVGLVLQLHSCPRFPGGSLIKTE